MRHDEHPGRAPWGDSLAEPPTEWTSNRATPVAAGAVLGLASGGLLAIIVVNSLQGNLNPGVGPLIGAIGLSAVLAGVLAISVRRVVERLGERLSVDGDGIRFRTVRGSMDLAWADIDAVRIHVAFLRVPSARRYTPQLLKRVPRPALEIVYRGTVSPRQERILRPVALPHPAPNGFTHAFGVVEVHPTATVDPADFAAPLQSLLARTVPDKFLGTTVDPD
jgi:hypothetical protein